MKRFSVILFFTIVCFSSFSQTITSADIYLGLRKLNVLGSVLYVAAHPDDENTRLITYFSKDRLYRTGYLSMTRGDGGQNLIGDEQGISLGLIRTQELLSARKMDGGEQFFTRAYDFGFSKNPEETFTKWDKEKILSDVVWIIRKFQPDVIITRFPTTGEGGHGHHTASAILANEAFTAAADPKRFPEQLKFVQPWQPKRIVWNSFNFNNNNAPREGLFSFDVGGFNPVLGKSYGEIAADSRSQHKSQGFGATSSRGEAMEFFTTTGGKAPVNDLFEDVDLSWKRVKGGEEIKTMIDNITAGFDFLQPDKSVKGLVQLYKAIASLPEGYWKEQKLKEVQQLIEQCSGLWLDIFTNEAYAVQTDSSRMFFSLNNRLGAKAILKSIRVDGYDTTIQQPLAKNKNVNFAKTIYVPSEKPITQPYWLQQKMAEGYFNVSDQQMIGNANVQPAYVANINIEIEGENFVWQKPVRYRFTDPVKGEIYQPLYVIPPYSLRIDPEVVILKESPKIEYEMAFSSYKNNNKVNVYRTPGLSQLDSFTLRKNENKIISFSEELQDQKLPNAKSKSSVSSSSDSYLGQYSFKNKLTNQNLYQVNNIKYDHIPAITYFEDSKITVKNFDLKTVGKKLGYIIGAGDKVPQALEQMGYEVTLLTDKELARNNLYQFDAIITGVRAYNTNEWMNRYYDKLMKYVEDGGNLIVQYNTSTNIGPVRAKIAPYNFNISRTRITDENAPVLFLKPSHAVLNFPNKISQDDFKGWIQERSIYHGVDTTNKFEAILGMNDPGEKQDNGSLLIAKYGKGYFTYTGLVFFRELPAGVPGAYRLMANLIALNNKKTF